MSRLIVPRLTTVLEPLPRQLLLDSALSRRRFVQGGAAFAAAATAPGCAAAVLGLIIVSFVLVRATVEVLEAIEGDLIVENPEQAKLSALTVTVGIVSTLQIKDPSAVPLTEIEEAYVTQYEGSVEVPSKPQARIRVVLPATDTPGVYWVAGAVRGADLAEDARFDADEQLLVESGG